MRGTYAAIIRLAGIGLYLCAAVPLSAQTQAPLSVIDWLDQPAPLADLPRAPQIAAPLNEPAVTQSGSAPRITTRPLSGTPSPAVGLVPSKITGMRPDIWAGSEPQILSQIMNDLPDLDLPAANALLFTLLLAEADAPIGGQTAQDTLTVARVQKLMALGAVDPALALIEQAGAASSRALFDVWMDLSLLVGTEDTACGALSRAPYLTQDMSTRIFCAARGGDWDTAALTFGSASALSLVPREKLDVLDRFLHPDAFDEAGPLPAPRTIDPLTFRLFETIGEPLPTRRLPRAYAVADLRDVAGWKTQLEAAERLTRAGALPDNRLLGLYTNRRPAASGGVWDHVRAVQQFDTSLGLGSAEAVAKTLAPAWGEMARAGLEVSFSALFAERVSQIPLSGATQNLQARMVLLSADYETVAGALPDTINLGPHTMLIRAVARGEAPAIAPSEALPFAIHDAFTAPTPRAEWVEMARNQRLGEALLATLGALNDGARGDSGALREALGTLHALGLEDTARRASLQLLLLEDRP